MDTLIDILIIALATGGSFGALFGWLWWRESPRRQMRLLYAKPRPGLWRTVLRFPRQDGPPSEFFVTVLVEARGVPGAETELLRALSSAKTSDNLPPQALLQGVLRDAVVRWATDAGEVGVRELVHGAPPEALSAVVEEGLASVGLAATNIEVVAAAELDGRLRALMKYGVEGYFFREPMSPYRVGCNFLEIYLDGTTGRDDYRLRARPRGGGSDAHRPSSEIVSGSELTVMAGGFSEGKRERRLVRELLADDITVGFGDGNVHVVPEAIETVDVAPG